jgi:hypothetical protein
MTRLYNRNPEPRSIMRSLLLALGCLLPLSLVACLEPDPLFCDEQTPCTDPARPFCDLEGRFPASNGRGKTCIADPFPDADAGPGDPQPDAGDEPGCEPGSFLRCADDQTAVHCGEDGAAEVTLGCESSFECSAAGGGCACEPDTTTCEAGVLARCDGGGQLEVKSCPLGCATTSPRCLDVNPANGLAPFLDQTATAPALVLTSGVTFNTDTGAVTLSNGEQVTVPSQAIAAPSSGVPVRVFMVRSLVLGAATFTGTAAAAVVSDGDIEIRGLVTVAGGAMPVTECGGASGMNGAGSGGGGFGTAGGAGGAKGTTQGGAAGIGNGSSSLSPLRGGCVGGGGSFNGKAGGALQLVSRIRIRFATDQAAGFITAPGRRGGRTVPDSFSGVGQGGGSGGGILLEAPFVIVPSGHGLAANGGGAAGFCEGIGAIGSNGGETTAPAPGGICTTIGNGSGGAGAAGITAAVSGQSVPSGGVGGGGGGGGLGRIRINVPPGGFSFEGGAIFSPQPSVGALSIR